MCPSVGCWFCSVLLELQLSLPTSFGTRKYLEANNSSAAVRDRGGGVVVWWLKCLGGLSWSIFAVPTHFQPNINTRASNPHDGATVSVTDGSRRRK